jgi:hypothetical protein
MSDDNSADSPLPLGMGGIDIKTHNTSIQSECRRLFQGQWFLSSFYNFCSKLGITVDKGEFTPRAHPVVHSDN